MATGVTVPRPGPPRTTSPLREGLQRGMPLALFPGMLLALAILGPLQAAPPSRPRPPATSRPRRSSTCGSPWPARPSPPRRRPWTGRERSNSQRTPDLACLVQEVVNQPNWQGAGALVLIISGSGRRDVESWDKGGSGAPMLYVDY